MTKDILDERTVIAFYGGQFTHDRLEALYSNVVVWFDSLNAHPVKLGINGEGFTGKVGAFRTNDSRLRKSGFRGVKGFSLYSLKSGGEVPLWDWQVTAEVSAQESICTFGVPSLNAPSAGDALLSVGKISIRALAPTYGIGFRREMRLGPSLYAFGFVQGLQPWGDEKPEVDRIAAWQLGVKNRVYEQGLLRDVYPWNFLTSLHLNQQVEGVSLKQWIEQNKDRGTLSFIEDDMLLWEVREAQIPNVRSVLRNAGMTFDAASSVAR